MPGSLKFELVSGQRVGRRAVGFLYRDTEIELTAKTAFEALSEKKERELRTRFDYWIDGGRKDNWFHGWPNDDECRNCFTFKYTDKNVERRFYGYLYHPQPKLNPGFQVCVLAEHAQKNSRKTDRPILLRMERMRVNVEAQEAIRRVFPDKEGGKT